MLNWNMSGTRARTHACMHDCTRLLDCAQRVFLQLREVAQIGAGGASIDAQMLLEQVGPHLCVGLRRRGSCLGMLGGL